MHSYQQLVEDGIAPAITCPEEHTMIPFEKDGKPVYWCTSCDLYLTPGVEMQKNILSYTI
jgi:hypothetical protein